MRLMIVEDEQRARRGLKNIILSLEQDHEIVAEAANGQNALELIKALKPEVVFTDIKMPYMDGLTLIKEVRSLGFDTKFVVISAYEEFEYARQSISLGVTEYLVKPIIVEDVIGALEAVTSKKKEHLPVQSLAEVYPDVHPVILRALKKIENKYGEPLNLKDMADELGVSPEYFSSLFSKNVGESFVRFLRNYRVKIAKTLYLHGNIQKEEVPYKVGFSDEKYFNRIFKETTGMSVSQFLLENKSNC
ncbi:MAG TPA: response regulator [Candidatus Pelethocola excrementipullorum]|nr:response regulator [Candidatus Pelethocola excrementipullorum]